MIRRPVLSRPIRRLVHVVALVSLVGTLGVGTAGAESPITLLNRPTPIDGQSNGRVATPRRARCHQYDHRVERA